MSTGTSARTMATGGLFFAGLMMVVAGIFQMLQGIVALGKNEVFATTPNYVFKFDLTAWGWIHLIIGIVVVVAGYFVLTATWARVVGIAFVGLQMLSNFFFLPYYPFWALVIIAIDAFVIWALAAAPVLHHGPRIRTTDEIDDLGTPGG